MSIYDVNKLPVVIPIGVQTENGVEPVGFDIRAWQDVWDDIKVNVWLTRPGEDAAYPAADTELVGTVLYWYPSEADTAIHGNGKVELLGLTEDKRKLSGWCETNVRPTSLATTQEMPEAVRPWVDQVMLAAAQAEAAVEKMPSIGENGNWHAWDADAGEYVDTGKPSRGEQGLQGIQGIPGQQGIQGERGLPGERGLTGERGPAGNPGKDGTSVTVANVSTSSEDGGTNTVTFSDGKTLSVKNGSKGSTGATGATGPTGPAGSPGKDGTSVTVASVATSSADSGANVVTFSDGKTVTILNGSKGSQGIQGVQGPAGSPGKDGSDGVDGDTRVYIGSDNPPEDAEMWVDPEGTVNSDDLPQASEENAGVVMLDATLTKKGAAADAKAVGTKVAKLSEEIAKLPQGGGGGNADWNASEGEAGYVKNRTHWVERPYEPIVWDGSTEGRDRIDLSIALGFPEGSFYVYKVSDCVMSEDDIAVSNVEVDIGGFVSTNKFVEFNIAIPDSVWMANVPVYDRYGTVEYTLNFVFTAIEGDFTDTLGVNVPSVGTYCTDGAFERICINADVYHTIDKKFVSLTYADLQEKPTVYGDVVRYDSNQTTEITEEQAEKARNNIRAAGRLSTVKPEVILCMLGGTIPTSAFADAEKTISDVNIIDIVTDLIRNIGVRAFYGCNFIGSIDMPKLTWIEDRAFYNAASLKNVILRNEKMVKVGQNAFTLTRIDNGDGYIYVPRALVDSYKTAYNWSIYASRFRALEDYTVDGTITGELDRSKI